MKKTYSLFLLLLAVNFAAKAVDVSQTDLAGRAYGEQLKNSTFEGAWDSNNEVTGWHGQATNDGDWANTARNTTQFTPSTTARIGSLGSKSAKNSVKEIKIAFWTIIANGTMSTGRIYANSSTASNPSNCARTTRLGNSGVPTNPDFYNTFNARPDSLTVWVAYNRGSTNTDHKASIAAHLHTDADFQDPNNNNENESYRIGSAQKFYSTTNGNWVRKSVPFTYKNNTTPSYILCTFGTNQTPGAGHKNDWVLVDDILMIYNPRFTSTTLNNSFINIATSNTTLTNTYNIEGTFSAYNVNGTQERPVTVKGQISTDGGSTYTDLATQTVAANGEYTLSHDFSGYAPGLYKVRLVAENATNENWKEISEVKDIAIVDVQTAVNNLSGRNDLTPGSASFTVDPSTNQLNLTAIANTGYRFVNWTNNINSEVINNATTSIVIPMAAIIYTANFEPIPYTITYNNAKGITGISPSTYTIEDAAITLQTLTPPAGYSSFDGWFNGNGTKVETIATGSMGDLTLTAKWTMTTYNITYHLNGGSNHVNNPSTYNVETAVTLSHPTKTGYTFNGWYLDAGFGTSTTELAVGTTENKELWAKWTPTHYNITYELNGGTNDDNNPDQYTIETPTFTLLTPTKPGYDFDGWFTDDEFTTPITEIAEGSTENITLYAKWKGTTYTINYHLAAGENNNAHNPATYTTTTPTIYLADASKGCHTFKGWFKEPTFENKVTEVVKGSTGELNLYPKFEQDVYTVTFASNNNDWGTVNNTNENSVICGSSVSVIATPQSGYEFVGWFNAAGNVGNSPSLNYTPTESGLITAIFQTTGSFYISVSANPVKGGMVSGSGSYASGNECMVTATANDGYRFVNWTEGGSVVTVTDNKFNVSSARTLVANFELIDYTITYHNVHTVNSNPDNYNLETETFSLADLSPRPYYDFGGWFNADNAPVTQIIKGRTGDLTLTAKWIPKTYTITYNPNNGESIANGNYNVETAVTLPTPTKTGYNFDGWFTNNGFTGTAVTEITVGSTGNKTLWAKWDLITYTITYHNVPSGVTNSNRTQYNINDLIGALSALVQDYYTFDGWYADAGFTTPISSITGVMGNVDIYAKWTPITYTITYNPNNGESIANGNYNVETPTLTLPTPTKTGYNFEGWFTNSGTTGTAVTEITVGSTGNKTLWAKWSLATYTITYHNVDNLYNPNQAKTSYTAESQTITLEPVEKEHHTFEGWFTDEGFTNAITQILAGSTGNLTLYAKLLPNQYIVSVSSNNAQGGVVSGNGTYGHGSTVTVTATPNSGYKFIGWTENKVFVMNAPASYTFTAEKARELVANFTGPLSVSDFAPEGIMAYAKDRQIFVRFTNDIDPEALIYLFDITGNLLHTKYCDSQEMSFNVSNIGLYFVQIGNRTIKVVVR